MADLTPSLARYDALLTEPLRASQSAKKINNISHLENDHFYDLLVKKGPKTAIMVSNSLANGHPFLYNGYIES